MDKTLRATLMMLGLTRLADSVVDKAKHKLINMQIYGCLSSLGPFFTISLV